jgi:Na+-transporting methylmalonyl-CoA/oxaloacetate decarboxylase beta subunit
MSVEFDPVALIVGLVLGAVAIVIVSAGCVLICKLKNKLFMNRINA